MEWLTKAIFQGLATAIFIGPCIWWMGYKIKKLEKEINNKRK